MWRDSQTQETATISLTGQLPSPSTPGQLEDAFSYGRTPEQSASAAPLSRSISSEQQSLASSLSRSSSTLGDHRQKPVTIPDPIISDDSRAKKRTSLLGALGIGRGLKKSRVRPNLSQSMISISEGESGSSETARSLDFSLHRKTSFAAFGSRLSTAHPHADSSSLKNDSSNEVRRTPSKLSRSNASPTTSLGLSSPVPSSSTKSIPPFPSMREQLQPFKQRSEFLMKWTSPAFSVRAKSKGSWKPRFVLLCAVPAMKGTDDMPIGGYHFTISTFKSNDMQDQEIERIRLSPDTVVCVTDEIGDGHLFVLKVACAISETPSSEWYFSMNEVSDCKPPRTRKGPPIDISLNSDAMAQNPQADCSSATRRRYQSRWQWQSNRKRSSICFSLKL